MRFSAHAGTFILCCVVLLFGTFIYQRVANTSLEYRLDAPQSAAAPDHDHPPLTPEDTKALGSLMEELRVKPGDAALTSRIADIFVRNKDWMNATAFLEKVTELTPSDHRAWHLLGFVRSQRGQYGEAAQAFEKAVSRSSEPQSMFSLGVMYRYHLNQQQKALDQFIAVKNSPKSDDSLRGMAEKEIFSLTTGK